MIRHPEETMKSLICIAFVFLLLGTSLGLAGEIYGTIEEDGKPIPAGIKVEVVVASKSFSCETDKFGTYHVFASEKGKGALTAHYKNHKLSADVFSYEKAARYDWTVEEVDGKLILKRK